MGRPKQKTLLASFDPLVIEHILRLRNEGRKVGPKSIYSDLQQTKQLDSLELPKPSTIAYLLNKMGLVSIYEKHLPLPQEHTKAVSRPHEVWQLDGQGALDATGIGRVNFLNVKDLFSGVYCGSSVEHSNGHNGTPSSDQYRNCLRKAFSQFGLPEKIQVDHAGVFHENKGKSPFPTRFHLWLISLGIKLIFSRIYRPTDQAVVERMHQTIENQVIGKDGFPSLLHLQRKTDERRRQLNHYIPSASFDNQPPLVANPHAIHSGRFYCPQNEQHHIDFNLVYDFLSKGRWIRKATGSSGKQISLGGKKYYLAQADKGQKIDISFNRQTKMFEACIYNTRRVLDPFEMKQLDYEYLQGDDFLDCLPPGFQFQLPFQEKHLKRGTTFLDL